MLKTVGFLTLSLRAILGAAAAFTDVTLVDHDGRPRRRHGIILNTVKPLFRKLSNVNDHPHPLIYPGGT